MEIKLVPQYIHNDDILKGYVILHRKNRPENTIHLDYVKITCNDTNKSIYCRVFGPGNQGKYHTGNFEGVDLEKSILLDAYYRDKLGIKNDDVKDKKIFDFTITKGIQLVQGMCASFSHPETGIRVSSWLGIASVGLGILSVIFGIISLVKVK